MVKGNKKLASSDPWLDPPSPEALILRREPVDKLNEENLKELMQFCEKCMRSGDIEGLLGVIGLNIEVSTVGIMNGKKVPTVQNRDAFLATVYSSFEGGNNENYTMKINGIEILEKETGVIDVTVSIPGERNFESFWGESVDELIEVSLYKGRPVVSKLDINHGA
jgi:hypothetical protein